MAAHGTEVLGDVPLDDVPVALSTMNASAENTVASSSVEPWISLWLNEFGGHVLENQENATAERVVLAQREMFLRATTRTTDVGGRLFDLIQASPETAYFSGSGDASDYLILLMNRIGINAHRVGLWFVQQSSHTAIEYYSQQFGKYVFYDPQFGVHLLNEFGVPAGMRDIQNEIARHGLHSETWSYRPVRVPVDTVSPADARSQVYESRDYADVLSKYFNMVAVRYHDRLPFGDFLTDEPGVRGKWTVYDNTSYTSRLSEPQKSEFIGAFDQAYSTDHGGRYHLDIYHARSIEPLAADALSTVSDETRGNLFLQQLQSTTNVNPIRDAITQWASRYVDTDTAPLNAENAPEILALALRRMYLQAAELDSEGGGSLIDLVSNGTDQAYWARCGSSADFMIRALDAFGIAARRVNHWFMLNDSHVTIEYYSQADGKFIFYDPLYAVSLVDDAGNKAGVADILHEISKHGFRYELWSYKAAMLEDGNAMADVSAVDPRYEVYNARNYGEILRSYWYVVAVRYEDYVPFGGFLPGSNFLRGKWTVYDNTVHDSRLPDSYKSTMLEQFAAMYSDRAGKRYQLSIHSLD